jgi:hypothetical protein
MMRGFQLFPRPAIMWNGVPADSQGKDESCRQVRILVPPAGKTFIKPVDSQQVISPSW